MLALLALLSCSTCPSFEETEITGATAEQQAEIEAAMADLQEWTGLDGVCVREVRMVPAETMPDFRGIWLGPDIELRDSVAVDNLRDLARHELCHALDDHLDLSTQAPELFTGDYIESDLYDTQTLRRHEDFADACQHGPAIDDPLAAVLAPECGIDLELTEREQWLMDHAFLWPDTSAWESPRVAMTLGEGVERGERAEGDLYADTTWAGMRWFLRASEIPAIDAQHAWQPWLLAEDPLSREELLRVALPLPGQHVSELDASQLVPGDDGLYVVLGDEVGTSLRVQADGSVELIEAFEPLNKGERTLMGVADGWLTMSADYQLQRWELATGAVEVLEPPEPLDDHVHPWGLAVTGNSVFWEESPWLGVAVDLSTGEIRTVDGVSSDWMYLAQPLEDGRWLAAFVAHDAFVPALYQPDTDRWQLPEDPCPLIFELAWDRKLPLEDGPWLETLAEPGLIRPLLIAD